MKKFQAIVFLIFTAFTFSAQFEIVNDVYEDTGTITAQKYGYKDHNNEYVAILKVKTDIEGLAFRSMTLDKTEYMGNGLYHVYMQPGSRMLEFMKTGFVPKKHQFPRPLESNKVYVIEVKGVGEKIEEITINIIGEPEDAVITFDGTEKGSIKKLKTSIGKHEMKVSSKGYRSWIKTIEVSTDNTMFNYTLAEVKDALVEIRSNPPGANVYIDGIKLGETPLSNYYPVGTYKIKLISDNYEDIEESIVIKSPETKKTYQLEDVRGTLTINTHEKAKVFFNDKRVYKYENVKLSPQIVNIRVEMNKAKTQEERLVLAKKDNQVIDMYPEISTGTVQVAVMPSDAKIEFWEDGGEKYTNIGSKIFNNVPVGEYNLKVSKKGYKNSEQNVKVSEGCLVRKSLSLVEGEDTNYRKFSYTPINTGSDSYRKYKYSEENSTQSYSRRDEINKKGSFGFGLGQNYGYIGGNLEVHFNDKFSIGCGLGGTPDGFAAAAFTYLYFKNSENTWRPRIGISSFTYIYEEEVYYFDPDYMAYYDDLMDVTMIGVYGIIGQKFMFGKTKKFGIDLDIGYGFNAYSITDEYSEYLEYPSDSDFFCSLGFRIAF